MIINFSISNNLSFNEEESLSFYPTNNKKDNILPINLINLSENITLLKSAFIFGANASGKTNFIQGLALLKDIITTSLSRKDKSPLNDITPFCLAEQDKINNTPTTFEIEFIKNEIEFRYFLSIKNKKIFREELYYTPNDRETPLFIRQNQKITSFNKYQFKNEIFSFLNKENELEKTRDDVPLVSVLASFNGNFSNLVYDFFDKDMITISGDQIDEIEAFELLNEDKEFNVWLQKILPIFQIDSISVEELNEEITKKFFQETIKKKNMNEIFIQFLKNNPSKIRNVTLLKAINGSSYKMRVNHESAGTLKALGLLAYVYKAIVNDSLLIIDEMDSKFHTLLTKYIISLFHFESNKAQILATVKDSHLLDTNVFRRDQIWITEKNKAGHSEIFSLVEYKEKQKSLKQTYDADYLNGKFGGIPYFESPIQNIMD